MKHKVQVPFTGFYGTYHGDQMDLAIEYELDPDQDQRQLTYDDLVIDTKGFYKEYAEAYLDSVETFLRHNCDVDISLELLEVNSPREYNFETDVIVAYISGDDIKRLLNLVDWNCLERTIKKAFTPRSGFIPHYSKHMHYWLFQGVCGWDEVQLSILLEQFLILEEIDVDLGHEIASNHIEVKT